MHRMNFSSRFYLPDVVKIWDAVSAYIESYMKQSKVISISFEILHQQFACHRV